MVKGFRDFILRGNVVDLAVAVIVGAAFTTVVTTLAEGVIQPLVARAGGSRAIGLGFQLGSPGNEATFVDFGALITALINFLITAAIVYFLVVVPVNRLLKLRQTGQQPPPAAPAENTVLLTEIRDLLKTQAPHTRGEARGEEGSGAR